MIFGGACINILFIFFSQEHCSQSSHLGLFGQILAALYQGDIVDEDDIRAFAARAGFYPGTRPRIRFTDKKWKTAIGKGFIPWVTETDGEDDTDESENESEDE